VPALPSQQAGITATIVITITTVTLNFRESIEGGLKLSSQGLSLS
jgi:hypothetical protein